MSETYNIFKELNFERKETFHSAMIAAIASHDEESQKAFFEMLSRAVNTNTDNRIINEHLLDRNVFNDRFERLQRTINRDNEKHLWIDNEVHLIEKIENQNTRKTEYRDRGRADIWIGTNEESEKDMYRLIIENKINAGNQYRQLRRYYRYLTGNDRINAGLFFLCVLDNDVYRQQAKDSAHTFKSESNDKETDITKFAIITYENDIKHWLEKVMENAKDDYLKVVSNYYELVVSLVENWKK